jgi:hypothetical protein
LAVLKLWRVEVRADERVYAEVRVEEIDRVREVGDALFQFDKFGGPARVKSAEAFLQVSDFGFEFTVHV